jgi:tol-pal system protein YbgF
MKSLRDSAEEMRQTQASLNAKLERILNEIQALNGKLEETNRRVRDLTMQPVPVAPAEISQTSEPPATEPSSPPQAAVAAPTGLGEQQIYQDAMGQYTKGRFEQALRAFQDLLDQFPGSPNSDDAQYMIGESYYGMKEYVDAVSEYDKLIQGYPDSDRVPGARLKKAFSLFSLGKKGQGVVELQQIAERYPETKEAEIARQRLEELGLQ